jgi:hypothetical protein
MKKLRSTTEINRSTNIEIQILEQVEGGVVIIYAETNKALIGEDQHVRPYSHFECSNMLDGLG